MPVFKATYMLLKVKKFVQNIYWRQNRHFTNSPQAGLGLIETVVAMGMSVLVITTLVSLSVFTLRSSVRSNMFLRASKLANKQMELVRAYRDQSALSWEQFLVTLDDCDGAGQFCFMDDNVVVQGDKYRDGTALNLVTVYFNIIDPANDHPNDSPPDVDPEDPVIRVSVIASWSDIAGGSADKSVYVYTDLSNWQNK